MLVRIKNASKIGMDKVYVSQTKLNLSLLKILKEEGFIENFEILIPNVNKLILVKLKFKKSSKLTPYISFLTRISKPGFRLYVNSRHIPRVWGGIGIAVFSIRIHILIEFMKVVFCTLCVIF